MTIQKYQKGTTMKAQLTKLSKTEKFERRQILEEALYKIEQLDVMKQHALWVQEQRKNFKLPYQVVPK